MIATATKEIDFFSFLDEKGITLNIERRPRDDIREIGPYYAVSAHGMAITKDGEQFNPAGIGGTVEFAIASLAEQFSGVKIKIFARNHDSSPIVIDKFTV